MNLSLNEVEALARKATRGAGYSWGLAEEAGKAVRWLCARDIDGCAALASLLDRFDGADFSAMAPVPDTDVWKPAGSTMCPLVAGTILADGEALLQAGSMQLVEVAQPVLLAPFAAILADQSESNVSVEWSGATFVTDGKDAEMIGVPADRVAQATVFVGGSINSPLKSCKRALPEEGAWKTLNRYAHRTYAPATEESRRKGAGAEPTGNA